MQFSNIHNTHVTQNEIEKLKYKNYTYRIKLVHNTIYIYIYRICAHNKLLFLLQTEGNIFGGVVSEFCFTVQFKFLLKSAPDM
jgi:hypothetical protein